MVKVTFFYQIYVGGYGQNMTNIMFVANKPHNYSASFNGTLTQET